MSVRRVLQVSVLSAAAALGCWGLACNGNDATTPSLGGHLSIGDASDAAASAAADGPEETATPAIEAAGGDGSLSNDATDGADEADAPALLDGAGDAEAGWDSGDASVDAMSDTETGSDAGDGSAPDTQSIIRTLRGASCLACAVNNGTCLGQVQNCESFPSTELADAGEGRGISLTQLCRETLTCVLMSTCEEEPVDQPDLGEGLACYCGDVDFATCDSPSAQGSCRHEEERGLDSTNPDDVLTNFWDPTYGGGMANTIADCLLDFCQTECFP
jgi:hypothetical protein